MWHNFKKVQPSLNDPKPLGYLVQLEGCGEEPVIGYYDFLSRRFSVYCPQIGKCIQVVVTWWMAIPRRE